MVLSGHNSIILFGYSNASVDYRIERWDPDTDNDEDLGPMHERLFASYVGIGKDVYIIGGRLWYEQGNETEQVDKFNVPSRRKTPCAPLSSHVAVPPSTA
ncbi:unnamed protein product [Dibothriocephalus latus]|uniref:Uncharacterized protein n=1 Tax=Dibothriocephalus latus TaxID=60516 RepID=A0A3P6RIC6_DIBLA|nr:unnamed protein product [Dibothriocephalus latus]